tara:strand:+ start:636 stop:1235 length:600 start_codon:yes stop_codon:yes gene_type:complete
MSIVKLNNRGVKDATTFGSISSLGSLVFISKQSASSSASISFTSGIDSTYKEYIFYFKSIHQSNETYFTFNGSIDSGSNYNVTKTTTFFSAYHNENGTSGTLEYSTSADLGQSTDFQRLSPTTSTDNDSALSGYLHLFNPSSTTFVKHFIVSTSAGYNTGNESPRVAGYFNTTSAINSIQFKPTAGTLDSGDILLFGVN